MKNLLLLVSTIVLLGTSCKKEEIEKEPIQIEQTDSISNNFINDSMLINIIDSNNIIISCYDIYDMEKELNYYTVDSLYCTSPRVGMSRKDSISLYIYNKLYENEVKTHLMIDNYEHFCKISECNDTLITILNININDMRNATSEYKYENYDDTTKNKNLGTYFSGARIDTVRYKDYNKIYGEYQDLYYKLNPIIL